MDNSYENLSSCTSTDSFPIHISESHECFICREGEGRARDALLNFCDCKSLLAHHKCLLAWIRKGPGTEDRPRCRVCTAEYHLQKGSAWRLVACRWQIWIICTITFALFAIVPFVVYRMMTAFRNPPPHPLFKAAAVCFGLLTETLLIKFLVCYCSSSYGSAKMSSFTVRARTVERCDAGFGLLWPAAAGQNSSTAVGSGAEERKQEVVMASEGLGLKLCV
ncbi:hypothetical protein AOXY_G13616 [Acipenser oxyrinchus oxyrinchus]|uniref:RING-CH-type domain-containing protein n=1 Tax=Acipenser oxyrinchus oxyrinchus TaxID=40147 RepID=A0AAD8G6H5_ACIOX|nr:hypothetical protein AOXY_G13616 [Acipenser oxyrinchus oxyrinchus]